MHHSGKDQSIDIGENVLERFAMLRWLRRKCCSNRARFVIRRDADIADCFTIFGDPIGEFVQLPAEFGDWNVAERWSIFHSSVPKDYPLNTLKNANNGGTTSVSST